MWFVSVLMYLLSPCSKSLVPNNGIFEAWLGRGPVEYQNQNEELWKVVHDSIVALCGYLSKGANSMRIDRDFLKSVDLQMNESSNPFLHLPASFKCLSTLNNLFFIPHPMTTLAYCGRRVWDKPKSKVSYANTPWHDDPSTYCVLYEQYCNKHLCRKQSLWLPHGRGTYVFDMQFRIQIRLTSLIKATTFRLGAIFTLKPKNITR